MKIGQNEEMLENGSFGSLLLRLSLPAVVIILIMIIYNIADTFFIGQTGDPNKIAAISLSMPIFSLLSGFGTLFGNGGTTSLSIAYGEGNTSKIKSITAFCLSGGMLIGVSAWAGIFFAAEPIALVLGADADTLDFAVTYLRVFSFSAPLVMMNQSFGSLIRADGDGVSAMLATMSGTILNIVLDWMFVMVFKWDIFGAALATDIGNAITTFMIIAIIFKKKKVLIPRASDFAFHISIVVEVISLGLPMACSTILNSVAGTIQNRLMISYGAVALAAQGVSGKVGMIVTMLIMGVCMGMQPAISYNFGAKNYIRMKQVVKNTGCFTVSLGIILSVCVFLFKDIIIAAFIDNAKVIAYGQTFVLAAVISGPMYAIYQLCQNYLQATGKASYAIVVSLLDKGLIFIPVLYIMNASMGVYGIAFSHAVTIVFALIVAVVLTLRWTRNLQ